MCVCVCVLEREREIIGCGWLFGWLPGPTLGQLLVWVAKWPSPDCLLAVCRVFPPVLPIHRRKEREREREREGEIDGDKETERERGPCREAGRA